MKRALSALLGLVAFCAISLPASAHAFLTRATPGVGGEVSASPSELHLEFSEGVALALSRVTLSDANGASIALDPPQAGRERRTLNLHVKSALAPGRYRVDWRVVSVDSHVSEGHFWFVVHP